MVQVEQEKNDEAATIVGAFFAPKEEKDKKETEVSEELKTQKEDLEQCIHELEALEMRRRKILTTKKLRGRLPCFWLLFCLA